MMDDDKMDEQIRRLAADYHRPPATPRDEMWEAIRARRGVAPAVPAAAPRVVAFPLRRTAWMAAAAVALLAVGIGIGRRLPGDATQPTVAVQPAAPAPSDAAPAESASAPATDAPATGEPATTLASAEERSGAGTRSPAAAEASSPRQPSAPAAPRTGEGARGDVYQFATAQHLARAEALLTVYRAGSRGGAVDAELSKWARDLLGSTRLLLDSPASDDLRRRRVLEDLELVLVQMVLLGPESTEEERELLDRALERGDVMTRLRTTVPANAWSAGSE